MCATVTSEALCPKCKWPRDEELAIWWENLKADYPDDPPELVTACRGALKRHWSHDEDLQTACHRAWNTHKSRGVTHGKIRHRVYHVTGNRAAYYESLKPKSKSKSKSKSTSATAAPASTPPPNVKSDMTDAERSAEIAKAMAILNAD